MMEVSFIYPEWTEPVNEETGAIQHLRLNEMRAHINDEFFPYLTSIMPYARLVSWFVWIYYRLELEREKSPNGMQYSEYKEKAARYYGLLATADIVNSRFLGIEHNGPVGVEAFSRALDNTGDRDVDFRTPDFGSNRNPVGDYKNGMVSMGLLTPMLHPSFGRREETILVPTAKGKKLAEAFQNHWNEIFDPNQICKKLVWTQDELSNVGEKVSLEGLKKDDDESKLLFNSARSSLQNPKRYDDFVKLTLEVAKNYQDNNLTFKAEDISKASLYRKIKVGNNFIQINLSESEALALLAYHELHTHFSFGADAILTGIVKIAKCNVGGAKKSKLIDDACEILTKDNFWKPSSNHKTLIQKLLDNSVETSNKYQRFAPPIDGEYGFETIQDHLSDSYDDPEGLIAWGSIILFQAACAQEYFDKDWIRKILSHHREVFGSYSSLEDLQTLSENDTLRDWVVQSVNTIIDQHTSVAESKGSYSRRFENVGEYVHYRADAEYYKIRGRFPLTISWLADFGLLQRKGNDYSLIKEA